MAVIPLVMYLSGLPSAFITKFITKWIGKKITYGMACVIGGCGCIWVHWGKQYLKTYKTLVQLITWYHYFVKKIFWLICIYL